jgi:hypothetical protein
MRNMIVSICIYSGLHMFVTELLFLLRIFININFLIV